MIKHDYDDLFIKYKHLIEDDPKISIKDLCKILKISKTTYYKVTRKKSIKNKEIYTVYISNYKACIILENNQIILDTNCVENNLKYVIEDDKEFIFNNKDIIFQNKIMILYKPDFKDREKRAVIKYHTFSKHIYYSKVNNNNFTKQHKTIFIANRNDQFSYDSVIYRVQKIRYECNFNNDVDKELFRIVDFDTKKDDFQIAYTKEYRLFFDCETVEFEKKQKPYMISYYFDKSTIGIENEHGIFKNDDLKVLDCELDFCQYIMRILREINNLEDNEAKTYLRIIGFNNFKFDNHFIINILKEKYNVSFKTSLRNGKITTCKFDYYNVYGYFNDLIFWLPDMNLKSACEDYEISSSKMSMNIVKYNMDCLSNGQFIMKINKEDIPNYVSEYKEEELLKYIDEENNFNIYEYVKDYCIIDTIALFEIYNKIENAVKNITLQLEKTLSTNLKKYYNFINFLSPAHFAGKIFYKIAAIEGYKRFKIKCPSLGKFIHKSYFGGRVNFGCLGEYTCVDKSFGYYDVTSEYPLCMTALYPKTNKKEDILIGDEINIEYYQGIIDKIIEKRKNCRLDDFTPFYPLDQEFRGIFLCDVIVPEDKTKLIAFSPMALKSDHDKMGLEYVNQTRYNIIVNTSFFKNYILSNYKIILKKHEFNIVFTQLGRIFFSFINIMNTLKTEAKKENKSKAKLLKLFSNSIAGKLAQKPIDNIKQFFTSQRNAHAVNARIENWEKSNHYLSTFITGEANFVIFSTLYRLSINYIINKVPLSERCGSILYMDTDSIMFDKKLCNEIDFDVSEEIKSFNFKTNYFDITWKTKKKFLNADKIFIIAKKSYIIFKNEKIKEIKLKGVYKDQRKDLTIENFRNIVKGEKFTQIHSGLKSDFIPLLNTSKASNYFFDFVKSIKSFEIQKSIEVAKIGFEIIECTNKAVLEKNKEALSQNNITKLIFTIPKL